MIYESVNTCVGSTGGRRPTNGAYITTGIATSLDYGHTWPTYRDTASFKFFPLPAANKTQGPNATLVILLCKMAAKTLVVCKTALLKMH
jgi:hypothetical protein